MNNNMNFDPMTGEPINQNNNIINNESNNVLEQKTTQPAILNEENTVQEPETNTIYNQQIMQNIPTVDQSKQEFINNTQVNSLSKKEEKKEGPNITFIIILFAIIFASIFFLFPYLQKIL